MFEIFAHLVGHSTNILEPNGTRYMHRQLKNPKFYTMVLCDMAIFVIALAAAYLIRFEFILKQTEISQLKNVLLWLVPL